MKKILFSVTWLAVPILLLVSCSTSGPQTPPQDLLDQIAATETTIKEVQTLNPPASESSKYQSLLDSARASMTANDYAAAMDQALAAHLEVERVYGELVIAQLEKYNPPKSMTYHYRQQIKAADDSAAKKDIKAAIDEAQKARKQAQMSLEVQSRCIVNAKEALRHIREDIETIYKPPLDLIDLYWRAADLLPKNECEKLTAVIAELRRRTKIAQTNTISSENYFMIFAPPDFVRKYGDPIVYEKVTTEGFLQDRKARLQAGTKVTFVRSFLFAPGKTFYYVKEPRSGIEGWMGESYIWPERAALYQK